DRRAAHRCLAAPRGPHARSAVGTRADQRGRERDPLRGRDAASLDHDGGARSSQLRARLRADDDAGTGSALRLREAVREVLADLPRLPAVETTPMTPPCPSRLLKARALALPMTRWVAAEDAAQETPLKRKPVQHTCTELRSA